MAPSSNKPSAAATPRPQSPQVPVISLPPELPPERSVVAINFGDTFSSIAILNKDGSPDCIANEDGDRQIATAVAFNGDQTYIGNQAKPQLVRNHKNVILGFRNHLILNPSSSLPPPKSHLSSPLSPNSNSYALTLDPPPDTLTPSSITSLYISYLLRNAVSFLGAVPKTAVLVVPNWWNDDEKEVLRKVVLEAKVSPLDGEGDVGGNKNTAKGVNGTKENGDITTGKIERVEFVTETEALLRSYDPIISDISSPPPTTDTTASKPNPDQLQIENNLNSEFDKWKSFQSLLPSSSSSSKKFSKPDKKILCIDMGHKDLVLSLVSSHLDPFLEQDPFSRSRAFLKGGNAGGGTSSTPFHSIYLPLRESQRVEGLSGEKLDGVLAGHFAKEFQKKTKVSIKHEVPKDGIEGEHEQERRARTKLLLGVEDMKKSLSAGQTSSTTTTATGGAGGAATLSLESLKDGMDFTGNVNLGRWEMLTGMGVWNLVEKVVVEFVEGGESGVVKEEIDEILLSGGPASLPTLSNRLRYLFPSATIRSSIHPSEILARGAALYGRDLAVNPSLSESLKSDQVVKQTKSLSSPVGIVFPRPRQDGAADGDIPDIFVPLFEKDTTLPVRRAFMLDVPEPSSTEEGESAEKGQVVVSLWEGKHEVKTVVPEKKETNGIKGEHDEDDSDLEDEEEEEPERIPFIRPANPLLDVTLPIRRFIPIIEKVLTQKAIESGAVAADEKAVTTSSSKNKKKKKKGGAGESAEDVQYVEVDKVTRERPGRVIVEIVIDKDGKGDLTAWQEVVNYNQKSGGKKKPANEQETVETIKAAFGVAA